MTETCNNCQQPLQAISPAQSEYVSGKTIRLPFTDICITVYHDKPTVQYDCLNCIEDNRNEREANIFYAGKEAGYREAEL